MPQVDPRKESAAQCLQTDERWLLVQRILATEGFQRAGQLRKILSHITQAAILSPEVPVREYDIACDVLERRADFDPAHDNIVRSQFSHLRRKLDQYYSAEGRQESLQIEIPKGSYLPIFSPRLRASSGAAATATEGGSAPADGPNRGGLRWRTWQVVALIALTCAVTLLAVNAWRVHKRRHPSNAFLAFLAKSPGQVSIVLPDTSQMMLQLATKDNITASEYASRDYPQRQLEEIQNPALRQFLGELMRRRNTSAGEVAIAVDFIRAFGSLGIPASLRYARDLHVSDFGEGNIILIGSRTSNPWVSLFTEKMNFQFVQDPSDRSYYFQTRIRHLERRPAMCGRHTAPEKPSAMWTWL